MTVEAPKPSGEQPRDLVQEVRGALNRELLGKEYHTGVLLSRTLQLQNALLQSSLSPEKIYHELAIVAGQGADRAEIYEDTDTAATLRELRTGFQLTYETFRPKLEASKSAQPMYLENYPPMIGAKGEVRQQVQPQSIAQPVQAAEAPATSEGQTTPKTETPQQPKPRRGRTHQSPQQ